MKKTKRFWAMLLTLVLCMGEFASTGGEVYAVEEDEVTEQAEIEEEYASDTAVKKIWLTRFWGHPAWLIRMFRMILRIYGAEALCTMVPEVM